MVSSQVIQKGLRLVEALPSWACLQWMHLKFMPAIQSHGEAAVLLTEAALRDWTHEGAAAGKEMLRQFISQAGRQGMFGMSDAGFEGTVHNALPGVLRQAIEMQTGHSRRTGLPVEQVQSCVLQQIACNDLGFLFSFYTSEGWLTKDIKVSDAFRADLHTISSMTAEEAAIIEQIETRVIVRITETPNVADSDPAFQRHFNLFENGGEDPLLPEFQKLLVAFCGLSEATVESITEMYRNAGTSVNVSNTGSGLRISTGSNDQSEPASPAEAPADCDDCDETPEDAYIVENTDPVDDTDAISDHGFLDQMD